MWLFCFKDSIHCHFHSRFSSFRHTSPTACHSALLNLITVLLFTCTQLLHFSLSKNSSTNFCRFTLISFTCIRLLVVPYTWQLEFGCEQIVPLFFCSWCCFAKGAKAVRLTKRDCCFVYDTFRLWFTASWCDNGCFESSEKELFCLKKFEMFPWTHLNQ